MSARHASIAAFHLVEAFLLSLTDARDDGRVLLSLEGSYHASGKPYATLKYLLLNPAERFQEVVEQARSVVLAGGTMEPVSNHPTMFRKREFTIRRFAIFSLSSFLLSHENDSPRSPVPTLFRGRISSLRSYAEVHERSILNSNSPIEKTRHW